MTINNPHLQRILAWIALTGFAGTAVIHVAGWFAFSIEQRFPGSTCIMPLALPVFIVAGLSGLGKGVRRKEYWQALLAPFSPKTRKLIYGYTCYAFLSFIILWTYEIWRPFPVQLSGYYLLCDYKDSRRVFVDPENWNSDLCPLDGEKIWLEDAHTLREGRGGIRVFVEVSDTTYFRRRAREYSIVSSLSSLFYLAPALYFWNYKKYHAYRIY